MSQWALLQSPHIVSAACMHDSNCWQRAANQASCSQNHVRGDFLGLWIVQAYMLVHAGTKRSAVSTVKARAKQHEAKRKTPIDHLQDAATVSLLPARMHHLTDCV